VVRIGYFANLTHAPALVGFERRLFEEELGAGVRVEAKVFGAGPEVVEAIFSNALDLSYVGPNPAINAYAKSGGRAIRILAGATSGGAALVVAPRIATPDALRGAKLATPQLGNTQDVALRAWLAQRGLSADLAGSGDVSILPQANAQALETFRAGRIDGAWVPEPWATRMLLEGGGSVLVDERSLWPDGRFVTTHVIVRTAFLEEHPDLVAGFLRAHVRAVDTLNDGGAEARQVVDAALEKLTGKALAPEVLERAFGNLAFSVDPLAASLRKSAADAQAVGLLDPVDLAGIYALDPLAAVLASAGRPPVRE
jgi:NitT/TauT family transport system substrate-binding protein